MDLLLNRFKNYVAVETRADASAETTPSSDGQHRLAAMLAAELNDLGLTGVTVSEHAYVTARLPGNTSEAPTLAFLAHLDTAPDLPGENESIQVFTYDGGDIPLASGAVISPGDFPQLAGMTGETLLTTAGNTLLGADNKAGIAIIMTAIERLKAAEAKRGDIVVAFTPDEEIGHGADLLDLQAIGADFGFTVDGGELGEFETENFNAAKATVTIAGRITHPGSAKGVMINANLIAVELIGLLPAGARPELTADREGFFMIDSIDASIENAVISLIIRDHDATQFAAKKALLRAAVAFLNEKYGDRLTLDLIDQYYNMAAVLEDHAYIETIVREAFAVEGVPLKRVPVRGGTDGARLTYRGLPCPNLFTGGYNFHSKTEFASLEQMRKAVDVVYRIALLTAEHGKKGRGAD